MRVRAWVAVLAVLAVLAVGGVAGCGADGVPDRDAPGSDTHPMRVTVGEPFAALGLEYAAGWSVGPDDAGDADVVGLRMTNARGRDEYVFVTVRLLTGPEVAASIACTGPNGELVAAGATVTMDCSSADPLPASWQRVTIRDTY